MMLDGGRSFCATATSACLDGADLINQTVLTCSGGVANGEGTLVIAAEARRLVRGLAD